MKISPFVFLLIASCGHIAEFETPTPSPKTWEEACLQRELMCLDRSTSGGVTFVIPFFAFHGSQSSPEVIVQSCKVQGQLCRLRKTPQGNPE